MKLFGGKAGLGGASIAGPGPYGLGGEYRPGKIRLGDFGAVLGGVGTSGSVTAIRADTTLITADATGLLADYAR